MEAYLEELDQTDDAGYLETDRAENVEFYRRFGFDIVDEATVLEVPNYFMWRKPTSTRRLTSGCTRRPPALRAAAGEPRSLGRQCVEPKE